MKIKISNELQPADLDPVMRDPQPTKLQRAANIGKTVGMGVIGAGAAVIDAAKNIKPRQDLKTI